MPLKDPEARREYHRRYMKKRYAEDKEFRDSHKARTKRNNAAAKSESRTIIAEFRADGCLLCDETEFCALSAHHIDSAEKDFNIGDAVRRRYGRDRIKQELLKCVCLCHNCHSKLHAGIIDLPTTS